MQKTLQNLSSVSLVFLAVTGGLHISAAILISEKVSSTFNLIIWNALDMPFLLSALLYGTARISLAFENITGSAKTALIVCSALSGIVLLGALFLNFLIPDAKLV
jgi:hypothetical protein